MPTKKSAGPIKEPATELARASDQNAAPLTYDDFDRRVADQVDFSIWRAVFDGQFRLARRCSRCERWLTSGPSKRAGIGAHCAAKRAAAEAVAP